MSGKSYWPPRNHQNYVTNAHSGSGQSQARSMNAQRPTSPTLRRATNMEAPLTGGKRKTIGGRGREWAHHCHKLLESMRELDDSEHFRNPVDSLKYKDYYSIVKNHMDLSQVMLKLHGGKYDDPDEFGADIKLIFDNWKLYCKDPKRHYQIYQAVHKLSWWFDVEFGKIMDNWKLNNRTVAVPKRMRASNGGAASPGPMSVAASVPARNISATQLNQIPATHQQADTNILVSIQNGNLSIFHQNQNKPEGSSSRTSTTSRLPAAADLMDSPMSPPPPSASESFSSKMELKMESTSIWFGPCRSKPQRPVLLTEEGFTVFLNAQDGKEHSFMIKSAEIVRCCGHLGKNKKHTLFIFITPPCEKRLKEISHTHNVFSTKPEREPCSIIAMFIKSLDAAKCSKLVYLFWVMSRGNIFGPLFTEVDQKGALSILANIKPQIMGRVQERVTNPAESVDTRSSDSFTFKSTKKQTTPKEDTVATTSSSAAMIPQTPESPPPPPERVVEPPASPEPSERGNPPRIRRSLSSDSRHRNSTDEDSIGIIPSDKEVFHTKDVRDSPLSPPPADRQAISDDDDLAIIEDPYENNRPPSANVQPASFTIDDDGEDVVIAEQHFSIKCPITQQTMTCPVRNVHCKHNYDRVGVRQLITNRGTKARCPVPGCSNAIPLDMINMEYDLELKAFIDSRK